MRSRATFLVLVSLFGMLETCSAALAEPRALASCPRVPTDALPRYVITADLEPEQRRLSVDATVRLPSTLVARGLTFKLRRDMGEPRVTIVGPTAIAGSATVQQQADDGQGSDATWRVLLARPLPQAEALTLRIQHSGGAGVSLNYYVGPEIVFANGGSSAWYPQFHESRALGELKVTVPAAFSVVAASEPGGSAPGARRTFTIRPDSPTDFEITAGPYLVRRSEGAVPVTLYLLRDRPYADDLIAMARTAVATLEREFGPYPFSSFAIAEVPQQPAQRSGFSGAAYEGYMQMRSDWLDAKGADPSHFGHEIGHNWWGVAIKRAGERGDYMLDEALAQYGGLRVVEAVAGMAAAERFRRGIGGLGGGRHGVRLLAAGFDRPLSNLPQAPQWTALSDSKGYLVYDMLSRLIGRDRLRRAFRRVTCERAFGTVDWDFFLAVIREAAGRDIGPFLTQWLDRPGLPVLGSSWEQRGSQIDVTVRQRAPAFQLDLPVRLELEDGRAEMRRIRTARESVSVRFAVRGTVRAVTLDPHYTVFHATEAEWADALARQHVTRADLLWDAGQDDAARAELTAGLAARDRPDATGAEFAERVTLGWIAQEAGEPDEAMRHYEAAVILPVRDAEMVSRLFLNMARVHASRGENRQARLAAQRAIAADEAGGSRTPISERAEALLVATGPDR